MKTIKDLKTYIENLPDDVRWYGYEGEDIGIVFVDPNDARIEVGFLSSKEKKSDS